MATTPATAQLQVDINDSIDGVRNAIRGLSLGMWKMHKGLTSSLRSEFSAQNKLLGWQGKNLQLIAQAITKTSAALIKQQADQFRAQQETMKETSRTKGDAGGKKAVDKSLKLDLDSMGSVAGIMGALSGLAIGFAAGIKDMFMKLRIVRKLRVAIVRPFNRWIRGIKGFFTGLPKQFSKGPFGGLFKTIGGWFSKMFNFVKGIFAPLKNLSIGKGLEGLGKFKSTFKSVFKFFSAIGRVLGRLFFVFSILIAAFDFWGGWTETQGTWWDKFWGGFSAAIKGFFGAFFDIGIMIEDGIKWLIIKIGGFLGFDEGAIEGAIGEFSIFKPLKDGLFAIVDWLTLLMTNPLQAFENMFAGYASVGLWIYNNALKPAWDWFEGMFPDAAAAIKPFFVGIADIGTWIYDNALKPFWDWIKLVFSDPMAALAPIVSVLTSFSDYLWDNAIQPVWDWIKGIWAWGTDDEGKSGGWSLSTFIDTAWIKVKEWVTSLFAWGRENPKTSWLFTTIDTVIETVKGWVTGLFTWASEEDESDSWIVKTVKGAVNAVKGWLGKLFSFDSGTDVIKSAFNLLTFFPNIIKDAVLSVSAWLLDLFGFGEAAKTVANAKEFSLGDMLFSAVESIWEWFKGLLDIDVMSIVKSIPGGETLMSLFGAGESSKAKDDLASLGIKQAGSDWGDWDIMDQEKQIRAAAKTMSMKDLQKMASSITSIGAAGDLDSDDQKNVQNLLMELSREKSALEAKQRQGSGGNQTNITTIQQNSKTDLALPPQPVSPQNGNNPARVSE